MVVLSNKYDLTFDKGRESNNPNEEIQNMKDYRTASCILSLHRHAICSVYIESILNQSQNRFSIRNKLTKAPDALFACSDLTH